MKNEIDIKYLEKSKVLSALYNKAKPQGMGFIHYESEDMEIEEAQTLLDTGQKYFDYIKGRVMKIELDGNILNTALYNRDNGEGIAEEIILSLRKNG